MPDPTPKGDERSHAGQQTSLSLLAKLRADQPDAWSRLDQLYRPLVYSWCARSGVRPHDFPDVCQEVFCVVFQRRDEFRRDRPGDTFRGWLRGITRHIILAHHRRVNGQAQAEGGTDAHERMQDVAEVLPSEEDTLDEVRALYLRAVESIRNEFPDHYYKAFQLLINHLTAPEVAAKLGVSTNVVRQANFRFRRRLHEELGDA